MLYPNMRTSPLKMISQWSTRRVAGAALLALALYVFGVLALRGVYVRGRRLEAVAQRTADVAGLLQRLRAADDRLALNIDSIHMIDTY